MKYAFIKSHLTTWSVGRCCEVLQVSRSGYYAWRHRRPGPALIRRRKLIEQIRVVHEQSRRVYGSPRVHQALEQQGQAVCRNTVARLMRQQAIRARSKRKFVPRTTDSVHEQLIAENVLDRQFNALSPNEKWVADIPISPPAKAGCTWRRCWTCSAGESWAGQWRIICRRSWWMMRF